MKVTQRSIQSGLLIDILGYAAYNFTTWGENSVNRRVESSVGIQDSLRTCHHKIPQNGFSKALIPF